MAETDLIVQCVTMSTIAREQVAGLRAAVEAGTGLRRLARRHRRLVPRTRPTTCSWSAASSPPTRARHRSSGRGRRGRQLPRRTRSSITDLGREHPITAGIEDFDLTTEQYWVLHDDLNDVLATTTHPVQPGTRGTGRSPRPPSGPGGGAPAGSSSPHPGTASTCWRTRTCAPSSKGACCGRAATRIGIVGVGVDLRRLPARPCRGIRRDASARSPTSTPRAAAVGRSRHARRAAPCRSPSCCARPRRRRRPQPHHPGRARRDRLAAHRARQARVRREAAGRDVRAART